MKELSIEEKAKAYDEALKVLHKYDGANIMFSQSLKEEMFPELREESEDKRIRKAIRSVISYNVEGKIYGFTKEEMIAWLEKQGEQKPTDKKGMNLAEEEMTPFQKKVFDIIDTAIEEEQGLKQVCDELFALASNEIEQKPAWSEEDEAKLKSILFHIEDVENKDVIDWLKSIKDRVQPQPKQEWSEEDERHIDTITSLLEDRKKEQTDWGSRST